MHHPEADEQAVHYFRLAADQGDARMKRMQGEKKVASPRIPSWNQLLVWLKEMDALRRR